MVNTQQCASYIPNALDDMSWADSYEDGMVAASLTMLTALTVKMNAPTKNFDMQNLGSKHNFHNQGSCIAVTTSPDW